MPEAEMASRRLFHEDDLNNTSDKSRPPLSCPGEGVEKQRSIPHLSGGTLHTNAAMVALCDWEPFRPWATSLSTGQVVRVEKNAHGWMYVLHQDRNGPRDHNNPKMGWVPSRFLKPLEESKAQAAPRILPATPDSGHVHPKGELQLANSQDAEPAMPKNSPSASPLVPPVGQSFTLAAADVIEMHPPDSLLFTARHVPPPSLNSAAPEPPRQTAPSPGAATSEARHRWEQQFARLAVAPHAEQAEGSGGERADAGLRRDGGGERGNGGAETRESAARQGGRALTLLGQGLYDDTEERLVMIYS